MATYTGFESFDAYVSDAGFIVFKLISEDIDDTTVMFPLALWGKIKSEIDSDIEDWKETNEG